MNRRRIAPRLSDGTSRLPGSRRLPEGIDDAIRDIARSERQSVSWVLEQIITDWVSGHGIAERPEYKSAKSRRLRLTVNTFTMRKGGR